MPTGMAARKASRFWRTHLCGQLEGGRSWACLWATPADALFLAATKKRNDIQTQICHDLNELQNFQNEHVAEVFLEMAVAEDRDWRQESGLLIMPTGSV